MPAKRATPARPAPSYSPPRGPGVGSFTPVQEPVGWVPPPAPVRREPEEPSRVGWLTHVLVGMLVPMGSLVFLFGGHGSLNSTTPDTGSARGMFTLALLLGIGMVALAVGLGQLRGRRLGPWFWIGSGLGLFGAAVVLYNSLWDVYGDDAGFTYVAMTVVFGILGAILIGTGGILVLVDKGAVGGPLALGYGVTVAGGAGVVAALFLMNLEEQAATARAVNEAEPGFGLLLAVAGATLAAWSVRKGRRGSRGRGRDAGR